MLCRKAIDDETLDLLKRLQSVPEFADLRLVGGTALALLRGHRKSIDLDLFGKIATDSIGLSNRVAEIGHAIELGGSENIHVYSINNVKVDIVNYPYPWLGDAVETEGIRLADIPDIAAMKLAAITNRGGKKDFVDIYYLLQEFRLDEMLEFYRRKFRQGSVFLSLAYFDDAETDEMPLMFTPLSWEELKRTVQEAVRHANQ